MTLDDNDQNTALPESTPEPEIATGNAEPIVDSRLETAAKEEQARHQDDAIRSLENRVRQLPEAAQRELQTRVEEIKRSLPAEASTIEAVDKEIRGEEANQLQQQAGQAALALGGIMGIASVMNEVTQLGKSLLNHNVLGGQGITSNAPAIAGVTAPLPDRARGDSNQLNSLHI
jgi:hypothetical protein